MNDKQDFDGNSNPTQNNNLRSSLRTKTVVINANGVPTIKDEPAPWPSKMAEIARALNCPEATPAEVSRLLSQEVAIIASEMSLCNVDATDAMKLKACTARLEAVKALSSVVKANQALATHEVLNFDGPKFHFVFDRLMDYYDQAIGEALGKCDDLRKRLLKAFRDIIAANEAELRRETKKIGS